MRGDRGGYLGCIGLTSSGVSSKASAASAATESTASINDDKRPARRTHQSASYHAVISSSSSSSNSRRVSSWLASHFESIIVACQSAIDTPTCFDTSSQNTFHWLMSHRDYHYFIIILLGMPRCIARSARLYISLREYTKIIIEKHHAHVDCWSGFVSCGHGVRRTGKPCPHFDRKIH